MKISSKEDKREVVDWAYRILLEREPDPDAKYYINMEPFSLRKIKYSIFDSKEYIEKFIINVANLNGTLVYLNPLDLDISENVRYGRYEPHIYSVLKAYYSPI